MQPQLTDFIAHARKKGMDHSTIRMLLLSAGWKEKDIAAALSAEGLDMPVPLPPDAGSARDAFYHLLTFSCFYTAIISTFILLFTYINHWLPDAAVEWNRVSSYDYEGIRWSLAMLAVTFPLYLWLARRLTSEAQQHIEKAQSAVRRWLTYLTLFITALAIIGDGVTLIYQLLQGELTMRFILKVLVVFVLSTATFLYYFSTLTKQVSQKFHRIFTTFALIVFVLTVVWGMYLVGSPMSERLKKFDDRRVNDLQTISEEMYLYVFGVRPYELQPGTTVKPRVLPDSLDEVAAQATYQRLSINDPESGEPYGYTVKDKQRYELCATFHTDRQEQYDVRWDHPAGRYCFLFDVSNPQKGNVPAVPEPVPQG